MKKNMLFLVIFVCLFFVGGNAFAAILNPLDSRPATIEGSYGNENGLQDEFDNLYTLGGSVGPALNAIDDQSRQAIFDKDANNQTASLIIELAGLKDQNIFGLYEYDPSKDNSQLNFAPIFVGGDNPGASAIITFQDYNKVTIGGIQYDFNNNASFGFYLENDSNLFFTEDSRNNDIAKALVYQGNDETKLKLPTQTAGPFSSTSWIIAFEDLASTAEPDFQDLVVMVSGIVAAVPEPATIVISSMFLLGAGLYVRRRLHGTV